MPEADEEPEEEDGDGSSDTFLWPKFIAAGAKDWDGKMEGQPLTSPRVQGFTPRDAEI